MMTFLRWTLALALVAVVAVIGLRIAFPLPDISDRAPSTAIPAESTTGLGRRMAEDAAAHPGQTGIAQVPNGHDALASRILLARAAERSIDAQYYIWHDDLSGMALLAALRDAAARGVRVRLLLDDNGVPGLDSYLAALNGMENFEIRLFNPSTVRSPKTLGYVFDFFRMNRRMHNKAFIVDGAAAVIGGRNIGDEYFEVGEETAYIDMDAIAVGEVVQAAADVFDAYWNSASAFAVETIIAGAGDMPGFEARLAALKETDGAAILRDDLTASASRLIAGVAELEWTDVQIIADDPAKGEGRARREDLLIMRLVDTLGGVEHGLDLASAYFVPGELGTEIFTGLVADGRKVRILTNALDTNDVFLVHAGYARYRRALLAGGVELYELRLGGDNANDGMTTMPFGMNGASLHAKTFAVDGERVFIGSFNFDPRSALLNCEMGFLIDSPTMARAITAQFDTRVPLASYRPRLTPEGRMVWVEPRADGTDTIYQQEPGASWVTQALISVIGLLPVEWML